MSEKQAIPETMLWPDNTGSNEWKFLYGRRLKPHVQIFPVEKSSQVSHRAKMHVKKFLLDFIPAGLRSRLLLYRSSGVFFRLDWN